MKTIKLGFTGTRKGMTGFQQSEVRARLLHWQNRAREIEFHHGDCHGSDEQAHALAIQVEANIYLHPSNLPGQRAYCVPYHILCAERPPILRNHDIVDATRELIATPAKGYEELRSGTWATIRYARKRGIRIVLIYPDRLIIEDNR